MRPRHRVMHGPIRATSPFHHKLKFENQVGTPYVKCQIQDTNIVPVQITYGSVKAKRQLQYTTVNRIGHIEIDYSCLPNLSKVPSDA